MNETRYWDIYALCSIYYSFINYDSSIKIGYQSFLIFLEKNLTAIPSERKNHKEVIEEFKSIMSIKTTPKTPSPSKKAINNIEKSILKNRLSELKNSRKLRSKSISTKRVITK
jgi:histidinol phosphatase-like PHP family hydrolase